MSTARRANNAARPVTEKPDAAAITTARVLDALDRGTAPWKRPWKSGSGDIPRNLATKRPYRGINVMLLWTAGEISPWWLTYKQAHELGGQVRKGEHHTPIVVWKDLKKTLRTAKQLAEARRRGDQITIVDGKPTVELRFSRVYRAFNVSQIDGLDGVPELDPPAEPTWDPIAACERTIASYPNGPRVRDGGPVASYNPADDLVRMPDRGRFATATDWYAILFHELGHSTGHESRLNRREVTNSPGPAASGYAREELTAEMCAAMLCTHCRIDTAPLLDRAAAYIDGWRRRISDDPKLVITAAQRAQKACDLILTETMRARVDAE